MSNNKQSSTISDQVDLLDDEAIDSAGKCLGRTLRVMEAERRAAEASLQGGIEPREPNESPQHARRDSETRSGEGAGEAVRLCELPASMTRMETGPVQFGDDWPGIFIRGDNAAGLIMHVEALLHKYEEAAQKENKAGENSSGASDGVSVSLSIWDASALQGLRDTLSGCLLPIP